MIDILALCGGGAYCYAQALLLNELGPEVLKVFQVYAGTSGGGNHALALGMEIAPAQLVEYWQKNAADAFQKDWFNIATLRVPRYRDKPVNDNLQKLLPGRFGDIRKQVFIVVHDRGVRRMCVLDNKNPDHNDFMNWEVGRMTSSAPSYFSPFMGRTDGGTDANDPSFAAITHLHSKGATLEHIRCVSIGTGMQGGACDRGVPGLLSTVLMEVFGDMFHASVTREREYAEAWLEDRFMYVDFPDNIGKSMADPSVIQDLPRLWGDEIKRGAERVRAFLAS